ncbi:MAG: aminopeptidase N [Pseudomonadota bacterium]
MSLNNPTTTYLADYQPPAYLIDQVDLTFQLHEHGTRVQSQLHIRPNPQAAAGPLCLNGEDLQPVWFALNGKRLTTDDWHLADNLLTIADPPREAFILTSEVQIAPETNRALEGLYRSGPLYCTQCEAEGFRRITWYIDRPDVMACFRVRIEADKAHYPVLLSNGNLIEQGELSTERHYVVWQDPLPKPCYLFALVAGDLRYIEGQHTTPSGKPVTLRIYVEPENIAKCDHALHSLQQAMCWDEQQYGREYDLSQYNVVAVNDFNMGAMENKGLNIFNAKFVLARPETATDQDYQDITSVIAHEYFHNWTGNRITCRDWFQLSLKEGLTVYRDQTFSADQGQHSVKRIDDVRLLRSHQFTEDASPMAHPVRPDAYIEIRNFYTATVYEKGAEVVRMQANLLGPEDYRRATDLYFARHDGQAVTVEDFMACMTEVSGRDFSQFRHWYDYAGTPEIQVTDRYDAAQQRYTLTCRQQVPDTPGQQDKPPFLIPLAIGLLDSQGQDLPLAGATNGILLLELSEREQTFTFDAIPEHPVPSLLRNFSAPVRLHYPYTPEQQIHLMAHDSDGFNRWDAAHSLLTDTIRQGVAAYRADRPWQLPDGLVHALGTALQSEDTEHALIAEILRLPGLDDVGEHMSVVDVDGIHHIREQLRIRLATALQTEFEACYTQLAETGAYQNTPAAMGCRCLKNQILYYLASLNTPAQWERVLAQYQAQHNMTDVMAALTLLADSDHPERQAVLDDFATRWQSDPLVMDKWFSVQATSCRANTLQQVQQLMRHPAFSLHNPNKVRALIGAFSARNPLHFHAADGSGYRFLRNQVQALDAFNAQIAARLLRGLARWQRYDATRQAQMQAILRELLASDLSNDVYEVAAKALPSTDNR